MWASCALCARADEGVVLGKRGELRPGLCAALRIQMSGLAEVHCEGERSSELLAERIAAAGARLRALDARLYVLLEHDPNPALLRMYIVSGQGGAVVAIERIENRTEPDVDRSLALKVRDTYEVSEVVREKAPELRAPIVAAVVAAPPEAARPVPALPGAPSSSAELQLLVELGGGLSLGARSLPMAALSLGLSRVTTRRRFDVALGVRLSGQRNEVGQGTRASLRERGPTLSARLLHRTGRFELGGALEASVALLSAEGVAADGSRGAKTRALPALSAAVDLRLRLFASAFLRLAPAVELLLMTQRFTVDDEVLIDEQQVRFTLPLTLVVALPVRAVQQRESPPP